MTAAFQPTPPIKYPTIVGYLIGFSGKAVLPVDKTLQCDFAGFCRIITGEDFLDFCAGVFFLPGLMFFPKNPVVVGLAGRGANPAIVVLSLPDYLSGLPGRIFPLSMS